MKKILLSIAFCSILLGMAGCKKDDDYLDVPPIQILPTEIAFSDPALVLSILGDLYNRQLDFSGLDNGWGSFADFSESFPSENSGFGRDIVQRRGWGFDSWSTWDYTYIRELNLFIQRDSAATQLTAGDKSRFMAEARFLRASYYFELVKRMGGVPLVTTPLIYDASKGDASNVQLPRSRESEIYDFVISEAEAIKNQLPTDQNDKSRATKAAALAMECRAALYAASIAKYGATTPQVALPGGEVGIPASQANAYYTICRRAANEIISTGAFQLYRVLPDLSDNFAAIFLDKSSVNQESIFIEDFKAGAGKVHAFTTNDQPYSISDEGGDAGRLNPSLNLIEAFEKTDGTYAPLATKDAAGNPIYYTNPQDIFTGRDARLAGTVLLPNAQFKGKRVDIWAGYLLANGSILTSDEAGQLGTLPGKTVAEQVVGKDGPVNGLEFRTQSGFYIRKWLDPTVGSGRRGRGSDVPFIRYRYAEVLLNLAEASFELNDPAAGLVALNSVRSRAGLPGLTALTFDRIVHERRVELAFEGHIFYDMKRWRLAHIVWDGSTTSAADLVSNIGSARKKSTQPWGLWPYKTYLPGTPNDGKWIFREVLPAGVTGANFFQFGNYYSSISDNIRASNPKIVRQPNQ